MDYKVPPKERPFARLTRLGDSELQMPIYPTAENHKETVWVRSDLCQVVDVGISS